MRVILDTAWIAGLLLALCRTAGFAAASPLVARAFPPIGRVLLALTGAVFLARPVPVEPTLGQLLLWAGANVAVGLVLAFVSGIALWVFEVAGEFVEVTSGLAVARVLDPIGHHEVGVLGRLFQMTGFALLIGAGGDRLLFLGLARSVEALPVMAAPSMPPGIGDLVLDVVGQLMVAAMELAAPALGALVLAEVVLAVAARLAPQANVFLLGLSAKIALTFLVLGVVLAAFPGAAREVLDQGLRSLGWALRGLAMG